MSSRRVWERNIPPPIRETWQPLATEADVRSAPRLAQFNAGDNGFRYPVGKDPCGNSELA